MPAPKNANESYCTFTLVSDVTAGGLPSEAEIAKDLESNDDNVSSLTGPECALGCLPSFLGRHLLAYHLVFLLLIQCDAHS